MKSAQEVSPEKLRGGYYTPPSLARFCLERLAAVAPDAAALRLLEPSVGDGAFLRALAGSPLGGRIGEAVGFEVLDLEAEQARRALRAVGVAGHVQTRSVLDWAVDGPDAFDLAAGNPPFVRFQFVSPADRAAAELLSRALGLTLRRVSNLWIPVLLAALSRLRPGGGFAFVIPTECFTGYSAQTARDWLATHCADLHFDLFPPGSFPGVLQEVTVLSGRRADGVAAASIEICEHDRLGGCRAWTHQAARGESWTRYLLQPRQLTALAEAAALPTVRRLGQIAAFEVSIVTGANDFFSVDRETLKRYDLAPWARPLLPRVRHATGLRYGLADQRVTEREARAWILDFAADRPEPAPRSPAADYLALGEARGLHTRFKCRIREPWYRVPNIRCGSLLLSKRSHAHPRVIVNEARVLTTDTIYRGRLLTGDVSPQAFAAAFHNSLTLLTSEIEGRSFGGGVLELVPSEIARLRIPVVADAARWLRPLDRGLRADPRLDVIAETDALLTRAGVVAGDLLGELADARLAMQRRRLARGAAPGETFALAA